MFLLRNYVKKVKAQNFDIFFPRETFCPQKLVPLNYYFSSQDEELEGCYITRVVEKNAEEAVKYTFARGYVLKARESVKVRFIMLQSFV